MGPGSEAIRRKTRTPLSGMAGRADSKLQRRRVPSAKRKRILQCRRKESAMKKLETRSMNEVADAPSAVAYSDVQRMIVHVRNQQVIIDADVAKLYGVETKHINQAVRNNRDKFPIDYVFALTSDEASDLRSKFLTANISSKSRALPKAFTEKGLYMLATVLKSRRATEATFAIIETFAKVRFLKRELVDLHTEADKQFHEWTSSYPDIHFVVIPGNHDFFPIAHLLFKEKKMDWRYEFSPNVHFLCDSGTEIDGVKFYGTPWVPIISYSWAFEAEHDVLSKRFSAIPSGLDVLITHSPPRIPGSDVDRSLQTNSEHFGSHELTEAIINKRPRFVFCGHIHTGLHGGVDVESCRVYNVSRLDERYDIAFGPTWVEA